MGCSVCQETVTSDDASAPNCKCSPATGGVPTGAGVSSETALDCAASADVSDATASIPELMPAAARSLRRLSSRSGPASCVVMSSPWYMRTKRVPCSLRALLPQFDDSSPFAG